jgi:hypothetical protein
MFAMSYVCTGQHYVIQAHRFLLLLSDIRPSRPYDPTYLLQLSLFSDIIFQSSPGLNFSTSPLTLSSLRNLGRPSGVFPCGVSSSNVLSRDPFLRYPWPIHLCHLTVMSCTVLEYWYSTFSSLFCRIIHSLVFSSLHGPVSTQNETYDDVVFRWVNLTTLHRKWCWCEIGGRQIWFVRWIKGVGNPKRKNNGLHCSVSWAKRIRSSAHIWIIHT